LRLRNQTRNTGIRMMGTITTSATITCQDIVSPPPERPASARGPL
jgi:hypothetical protein